MKALKALLLFAVIVAGVFIIVPFVFKRLAPEDSNMVPSPPPPPVVTDDPPKRHPPVAKEDDDPVLPMPSSSAVPGTCRAAPAHLDRTSVVRKDVEDGGIALKAYAKPKKMTAAYRTEFHEEASNAAHIAMLMKAPVRPISDPATAKKFNEAKQLVLSRPNPPCAYKWEDVRALIEKYGGYLVTDAYGRINPYEDIEGSRGAFSSSFASRLFIGKENLNTYSARDVARAMIQNASAVVFTRSIMAWSGFGILGIDGARSICPEFSKVYYLFEITAQEWNAGRFLANAAASDRSWEQTSKAAVDAVRAYDRGSTDELFLVVGMQAARLHEATKRLLGLLAHGFECAYPPRGSGAQEGMEIRPQDMDDPMVNLMLEEVANGPKPIPDVPL